MNALPSCTDYITSIETPQLIRADELRGGEVVRKNGKPLRYAGGFCVVFPYMQSSGKKVAVRCWTAHVPDADKRSRCISQSLSKSGLPYFVGFEYIDAGIATSLGVFPIVIMDWVNASPLKVYLKKHLHDSTALKKLAADFKTMTSDLHGAQFSHGDLQHGNIMVTDNGQLFLVDYDSMFVPGLENVTDEIKGLAGYQHPGRTKIKYLSPKADYFSELIIYTSILAIAKYPRLWDSLDMEDTETLLFSQEDIENPQQSAIFRELKQDNELSDCVSAIEKALQESDIENLLPLEDAVISQSKKIIGGLQGKWNQPRAKTEPEAKIDIDGLCDKWKRKPHIEEVQSVDVAPIANKWRK
jgi:serine/threonine protein kinase